MWKHGTSPQRCVAARLSRCGKVRALICAPIQGPGMSTPRRFCVAGPTIGQAESEYDPASKINTPAYPKIKAAHVSYADRRRSRAMATSPCGGVLYMPTVCTPRRST